MPGDTARLFLDRTPFAAALLDGTTTILAANARLEQLLGHGPGELIGRSALDLVHPDDHARVGDLYADLAHGLSPRGAQTALRARCADGSWIDVDVAGANLLDDPTMNGVLVTVRLVGGAETDRRAAWFEAVVRQMSDVVHVLDASGRVTYMSHAVAALTGLEPGNLVGHRLTDLAHPSHREALEKWLGDVRAHPGEQSTVTAEVRTPDGRPHLLESRSTNLLDDPVVQGIVVVSRDITDQRALAAEARLAQRLVDASPIAVVASDLQGNIRSWNPAAERLLGWAAEEAVGRRYREFAGRAAESVAELYEALPRVLAGETVEVHTLVRRRDGSRFPASVVAAALVDDGGQVDGYLVMGVDLTELEEARRDAERQREAWAAQQSTIATITGRALGGALVEDVLDEACRLGREVLGLASLTASLHDEAPPAPPPPGTVVCPIQGRETPVGTLTAVPASDRPLGEADIAFLTSLANVLGTVVDRARVADEMRRRALHDDLTDLPNRALLVDRLGQAIGRGARRGEQVAVLFVDLDRFKRVNDTFGHAAGDTVLIEAARRLVAAVRAGDTVARVGGDEFIVLCEDVSGEAEAVELARRIVAGIAVPIRIGTTEVVITASVGVVVAREAVDPELLVRDADLAMYRAKELGRNRVERFDAALRDEVLSRMDIEQGLRQALDEQRLRVVYQPQADLRDGTIVGLEALVRWDHPDAGPVEPSALVGVADEIGVLDQISWFVLREACTTVARLRRSCPDLAVSVNLGARQLTDSRLLPRVRQALAAAGLEAGALIVEVTETETADEGAGRALAALRAAGVRVSLDDFGTGWPSLHRPTRLPVDEIKVDRSFVAGVGEDRGCDAVIGALASMADELGLRLVAEGVEEARQRDRLLELGCRIGQGWLYGGPVDGEALTARLCR